MIYHLTLTIKNFYNTAHNNYRDNIPAIRDWSNSVYFYNKDNIKNVISNDNTTNKIISSYFNLNILSNNIVSQSKRMRNLQRKFTTRQLFTSKSFIKQTINKCIVTIYTFDRERKKLNNYFFFIQKRMTNILKKTYKILKEPKPDNVSIIKYNSTSKNIRYNGRSKLFKLNNNLNKKRRNYNWLIKRHINNKLVNYNYNNTYNYDLLLFNILKKKDHIKQLFLWNFFKWYLKLGNFYVIFFKTNYKLKKVYKSKNKDKVNDKSLFSYRLVICSKKDRNKFKGRYVCVNQVHGVNKNYTLEQLNSILIKFINLNLPMKHTLLNDDKLDENQLEYNLLYKEYFNKYYKRFVNKYLLKEKRMLNNINKLNMNNFKTNSLILGLKMLLNNIYNKDIELNIVNLKHPQLNSDILITALSKKLKKRKSRMGLVLNKCLKLIKICQKIHIDDFNNGIYFKQINMLKSKNINNINNIDVSNKDKLNKILTTLFSNFRKSKEILLNKTLLTNLKHKWVTGIKLQAAGRLSKRFVAARSMYKFIYKGNIRNMEYKDVSLDLSTRESVLINRSVNSVRNTLKSNIEYTLVSSKRRIGSFGVKGWINNN